MPQVPAERTWYVVCSEESFLCLQAQTFSVEKVYLHVQLVSATKAEQPGTGREAGESRGVTEHRRSLVGSRLSLAVTPLLC